MLLFVNNLQPMRCLAAAHGGPATAAAACRALLSCQAVCIPLLLSGKVSYAAAAGIVPEEEVGPGGGGLSQQKAKEMQRRLDPYDPQRHRQGVSIVHKHGMSLLFDPWYNKGEGRARGLPLCHAGVSNTANGLDTAAAEVHLVDTQQGPRA
jgi:hypothetical protein